MEEVGEVPTPKEIDVYKVRPFDLFLFRKQLSDSGFNTSGELITKTAVSSNLLGSGGNGDVYRIPEIDDYVLRVPNGKYGADTSIKPIEQAEDKFPELNIGQAVARMGGHTILKMQQGVPAGVPYGPIRKSPDGLAIYRESLARVAQMPQTAYNSLGHLFKFLSNNRMKTDPSKSNNILVDTEGQKFNVVDVHSVRFDHERLNDLGRMVVPLMDNAYAINVIEPGFNEELTESRRIILLKSIEAARTAKLSKVDKEDPGLAYSFKLAGMEGQMETVLT